MSIQAPWIEVLAPGRYRLADGRTVEYTREDTRNAERQGKAMLRAGLSVPLCWEHDPRAEPAYLSDLHKNAWLARGYFGRAADFQTVNGVLFVRPAIDSPNDLEQFKRVGKVSPRLDWDWTDEQGKTWPGLTVGHIASTPKPVQRSQSKIGSAYPSHLSHAAGGTSRRTDYLSQSTRLPGAEMADPIEPVEGADEVAGGGNDFAEIVAMLRDPNVGLMVPEGISDIATLKLAMQAAIHTKHGPPADAVEPDEDSDDDGMDKVAGDQDGVQAAGMPPAMMSQINALYDGAAKAKTDLFEHRIRKLQTTGRIDVDTATSLRGKLKAANLSHESFDTKTGKLKPQPFAAWIEAYEALPPGRFAKMGGKTNSKAGNLSLTQLDRPALGTSQTDDVTEAANLLAAKARAMNPVK